MGKFAKITGYLSLSIGVLFLLALLNWESLGYFVLKRAAQHFANRADIQLDIADIHGRLLSQTIFEKVAVSPRTAGRPNFYKISAEAITCSYNLWDLQEGLSRFLEGLECSAAAPDVWYDLSVEPDQDGPGKKGLDQFLSTFYPRLEVLHGTVFVHDVDWDAELQNLNVQLDPAGPNLVELQIKAENFRFNREGVTRVETPLQSTLRYTGSELQLESLKLGEEVTATGVVDLSKTDTGYLEFAADLEYAGNRLEVAGSVAEQLITVSANTEKFDAGELQKRLGADGSDMSGTISGQVNFSYKWTATPEYRGTFALEIASGSLGGADFEEVSAAGGFDQQKLSVNRFEAKFGANHFLLSDLTIPLPVPQGGNFPAIIRNAEARFQAEITEPESLLRLAGTGEDNPLKTLPFELLRVEGYLKDEILHLRSGRAVLNDADINLNNVTIPVPVLLGGNIFAILENSKAQFRAEITGRESLLQLAGSGNKNRLAELQLGLLSVDGFLENGVLHFNKGHVVVNDADLNLHNATIPVPASLKNFETVPLKLSVSLKTDDLHKFVSLGSDFPINGRSTADFSAEGTMREIKTYIDFRGADLYFKETLLGDVSLKAEMDIQQKKTGTFETVNLKISELHQINTTGSLSLQEPAEWTWQQGKLSGRAAFLLDGEGKVSLAVERGSKDNPELVIMADNLGSSGWLSNYVDNRFFFHNAEIVAIFPDPLQDRQFQLAGTVEKAGGMDIQYPLSGSFKLHYSTRGIRVEEFTWESPGRNRLTLKGFLPYDPLARKPLLAGDLEITGQVDFSSLADIAFLLEPWGLSRGSLVADMSISGSWDQPEGHFLVRTEDLQPLPKLSRYVDSPVDFSADLIFRDGMMELKSADLELSAYSIQASGTWQHGISLRDFLLQKRRAALQGEISADAAVKLQDLNFLKKYLPWLRRIDGDMQGEVQIRGPINNPAVYGSLSLEDGEISHTFNFPTLAAVDLQAEFDRHSLTIRRMLAEIGGSPVTLNGILNKDDSQVSVDLQVEGKNVLLFRNNDMRVRGNVKLGVNGPVDQLFIKGSTGLTSGFYGKNFDFFSLFSSERAPVSEGVNRLFSFPEPPLRKAVFEIKITTVEPFIIRNNLIRGSLRPELSLQGTGEFPYLVGTIYLDPSRILLPSGRMQVQSGVLSFPAEAPNRPQLDLLGNSKVLGYDINVVFQGPLAEPVITLNSSPPLPNDELLLLLLTGQPPSRDITGGANSSGTTKVMVYLGRDFLNKWLEDESNAANETLLDRFELDYGRDVTRTGEQTVETSFRLSEQSSGTGKILYLTGEKDRYDEYNYGLKLVFRFE